MHSAYKSIKQVGTQIIMINFPLPTAVCTRQTHSERGRQTDRQADRQTGRQRDRETERQRQRLERGRGRERD